MLLTEINVDDRCKLMQLRIERMRRFFTDSLPYCQIQVTTENILMIACPNSIIVDDLLDDLEDLCHHARLIIGVKKVALYFGQEEILLKDVSISAYK
jgi:hypothetical protein